MCKIDERKERLDFEYFFLSKAQEMCKYFTFNFQFCVIFFYYDTTLILFNAEPFIFFTLDL